MEYRALFWIACLVACSLPWIMGVQALTREAQFLLEMKESLKDPHYKQTARVSSSGVLVDQAKLVSKELIRVVILWHEMWHEGLEEASCLYFGKPNIEGMLNVLEPLHAMLEQDQIH